MKNQNDVIVSLHLLILLFRPSQHGVDFLNVSFIVVRRFQNKWQSLQHWMEYNPFHCFQTDGSLAQLFMTVLMGSTVIFTVIEIK